MTSSDPDSIQIQAHYEGAQEHERLAAAYGLLEKLRTMQIIGRHLGASPLTIADVGGGPGEYASWLAEQGHNVQLLDPVSLHVEQAGARFEREGVADRAATEEGDARSLPWEDNSFDAVLLLGPLYHLTTPEERVRALNEAARVARSGAPVFIAAISRFASFIDGFRKNLVSDPEFVEIMRQDLATGQHRAGSSGDYFTTAYLHHPDELRAEVDESTLSLDSIVCIEGPLWMLDNLDDHLGDPARRQLLLDTLATVEHEPSLLGASSHFMAVARAE